MIGYRAERKERVAKISTTRAKISRNINDFGRRVMLPGTGRA